jgi:hypothetical protein
LNNALNVAAASQFNGNVGIGSSSNSSGLTVYGASVLNNSLNVVGASSFGSSMNVTGAVSFGNDLTIQGNLTVLGTQTSINTTIMEVKDNAILIADNNQADALQSGIEIQYKSDGASAVNYAGLKRLPQTGEFVFFKDATAKISETGVYVNPTFHMKWVCNSANTLTLDRSVSTVSNISTVTNGILSADIFNLPVGRYTVSGTITNPTSTPFQVRLVYANRLGDGNYLNESNPYNYEVQTVYRLMDNQTGTVSFSQDCTMTSAVQFGIVASDGSVYTAWNNPGFIVDLTFVGVPSQYDPPASVAPTDTYAVVIADSFNSASDLNLKNNIVELDGALNNLDKLRGVYHHWIYDNLPQERQIGVIAQEVQAVYPELVNLGGNGFLSVNYPKLTAVLLQSLKELKAKVLEIEERL